MIIAYAYKLNFKSLLLLLFSFFYGHIKGQQLPMDSVRNWSTHFQLTVISQKHLSFPAKYSGLNSLADSVEPGAMSVSATLFLGRKFWKNAAVYFNPEMSGGRGLSNALGVAGALNGETYRVGSEEPQLFIARGFIQQIIPLTQTTTWIPDDENQLAQRVSEKRIIISAGKFAISDFFDDNAYAKDPRTQFFNWSLWGNGSWDYPADTRGYTYGLVTEWIQPKWSLRFSTVAEPVIANFHEMEYNLHAHGESLEFQHSLSFGKRTGNIRFLASSNHNRAPSYKEGIKALADHNQFLLDVLSGDAKNNSYGGHKYGFAVNVDQQLTDNIGIFSRVGWNDGKYATWAFTEIDRTATVGLSASGSHWKRPDDVIGLGVAVNGISKDHREFLKNGGYGFIIGDGQLRYGVEQILEIFYNARLFSFFWLTGDYQFVRNPAYNKDRGPVNVFALRGHIAL